VQVHSETLGALKRLRYGVPNAGFDRSKVEMRQNLLDGSVRAGRVCRRDRYEETSCRQMCQRASVQAHFNPARAARPRRSRAFCARSSACSTNAFADRRARITTIRSPRSRSTRALIAEAGDDTPIAWVRDGEKPGRREAATPDVTIADLIGDLDPIRAARGGHVLSDELKIHYGMLPRVKPGIFAMNELRISPAKCTSDCSTFMQERMSRSGLSRLVPLDVQLCFTPTPRTTRRAEKIITPLKDRIGSESRRTP